MNKLFIVVALLAMFSLSACGMKRALTMPENNKAQADEKDLMEF
jgi:predicted small lipoprotein YifL